MCPTNGRIREWMRNGGPQNRSPLSKIKGFGLLDYVPGELPPPFVTELKRSIDVADIEFLVSVPPMCSQLERMGSKVYLSSWQMVFTIPLGDCWQGEEAITSLQWSFVYIFDQH